ncbi:MAG: histidine phosphatase family protein, partial [Candidatus Staskawiczbacteria bacterium]|nr:histidine phosphatase family protein [Candidatus Staskawiczbacteria bacterium]
MSQLYLQRHLKSQWNLENRFTGWTDVSLCQEGVESAQKAAEGLTSL